MFHKKNVNALSNVKEVLKDYVENYDPTKEVLAIESSSLSASEKEVTNLVNIVDRVIEDGSLTKEGFPKQFNVNSIQIAGDDAIVLITHEVLGFDEKDKKYLLDNDYTYIPYKNVLRVF